MTHSKSQKFLDKFSEVAGRFGNQVHLRSLRDAFAMIMPLFILAGIGTLINNVVFPKIASGDTLAHLQVWGTLIANGTLNIAGLMLAPVVGFILARNRNYTNPIMASIIALASLVMMMPVTLSMIPTGAKKTVEITGALSFTNLGTTGMFAGIIIGLLATEVFIRLSNIKRIQINLGDQVPPAVSQSFNALIPATLTLSLFALLSALLIVWGNTNLIALITTIIQEPLRRLNTSLPGMLIIYSVGNFLYTLGIHQAVINGTLLDPVLLVNMAKNTAAYAAHKPIPYIMSNTFRDTFGMLGGTGSTIALLIAIFFFSKLKSNKDIAALAVVPGIFNINEPVIFGFPIVFNLPMMIPFVLNPVIGILIAYAATVMGFMNRVCVMVPWTTPPLINGFLATAGDWRAVIVQLLILIINILIYIPFLKVSDRVMMNQAEQSAK